MKATYLQNAEARFWQRVDKSGECWVWTASTNADGYGQLRANGSVITAHRFSFLLHNGNVGEGLLIRHKCDNRRCVNPAHLVAGTHQDNANDRVERGRAKRKLCVAATGWE